MPRGHRACKWPPPGRQHGVSLRKPMRNCSRKSRSLTGRGAARTGKLRTFPPGMHAGSEGSGRVLAPGRPSSPRRGTGAGREGRPRPWTSDCRPAPSRSPSVPCPAPGPHHRRSRLASPALLPKWPQCQGPGRKRRAGRGLPGEGGGRASSERQRRPGQIESCRLWLPGSGHSASRGAGGARLGRIPLHREVGAPPNQPGVRSTPQESCV